MLHAALPADTQNKMHLKYHMIKLNHHSFAKWSTVCTRQDLGMAQASCSMLHTRLTFTNSVTVSVAVSEMRVMLHQARGESQWIVSMGYRTQQILDAIKRVADDSFVFQQDSASVHLAFNTVQLTAAVQNSTSFLAMAPYTSNNKTE